MINCTFGVKPEQTQIFAICEPEKMLSIFRNLILERFAYIFNLNIIAFSS